MYSCFFLLVFSQFSWVGLNTFQCDKLHDGQTHLLHNTKKDDSHQLLLCSALSMLSILVYRHMGTLGKCQTDASKVHRNGPFYDTRSSLIRACTALCAKTSNYKRHSQPFIDAVKDPLGRFFFSLYISSLSVETQGPSTSDLFKYQVKLQCSCIL